MHENDWFYLEDSPYYTSKFTLTPNHEKFAKFFETPFSGSYAVIPARLLDLSFASYLRFARDILKAEIIGRNHKYPILYFEQSPEVFQFIRLLNKRMDYVAAERENPYKYTATEEGIIREEL